MSDAAASTTSGAAVDVVVVGTGFGGLYSIYRLRELGLSVRAFEAADEVGGTWHWNTYPGARCDVESMQYSFSFSDELQQEWDWSTQYAEQPEIKAYAEHVADRFELREHITFNTRVTAAAYDESARCWRVSADNGDIVTAQFVVLATGILSAARIPDFPGIETFAGAKYHTARWPRNPVDFSGKRVAVIGTGSTGVQVIPLVAKQAAALTVFQRTANYCIPVRNRPLTDDERGAVRREYAELREQARHTSAGVVIPAGGGSAHDVTPEQRLRDFEERQWLAGVAFLGTYNDILTDAAANEYAAQFIRDQIARIVPDPATAKLLMPTDHPIGTKRICLGTDYYETFNRDNVALVDVRDAPITEVTERGLIQGDEEYEFDAIIFATGFDALTGAFTAIDTRGVSGQSLREKWAAGPVTYLGLQTAGFPNLFMLTGPGSPSALSNVIVSIEQHVEWVADCLAFMQANGYQTIEARPDAEQDWVEHVNVVAGQTLFGKANSWFIGANVPGKPRVFMPYAGGVGVYRQKCAEVAASGYDGFELAR